MVREMTLSGWTILIVVEERIVSLIVEVMLLEFTTVVIMKTLVSYVLLSLYLDLVC